MEQQHIVNVPSCTLWMCKILSKSTLTMFILACWIYTCRHSPYIPHTSLIYFLVARSECVSTLAKYIHNVQNIKQRILWMCKILGLSFCLLARSECACTLEKDIHNVQNIKQRTLWMGKLLSKSTFWTCLLAHYECAKHLQNINQQNLDNVHTSTFTRLL